MLFTPCICIGYYLQATYVEQHLVAHDPFSQLDVGGVGGMIQMAVRRCRRADHRVKVRLMFIFIFCI